MEGTYCVYLGNQASGRVEVTKSGLYYQFRCCCRISGDILYRLVVAVDGKQEKLGILIPTGEYFGLNTRLPCKRLGRGEPHFLLLPKTEAAESCFAAIFPDEPFSYIEQLKESFLVRRYGQSGIILK